MKMFIYLFYTIILELPIVVFAYKNEWKTVLMIDALLNLFTWPLLTLLYFTTNIPLLFLEISVVLIEASGFIIFFKGTKTKAFLISFIANATSLFTGMLIQGHFIKLI
jgi:hypothetical protein